MQEYVAGVRYSPNGNWIFRGYFDDLDKAVHSVSDYLDKATIGSAVKITDRIGNIAYQATRGKNAAT